jgi:hypothetical protein
MVFINDPTRIYQKTKEIESKASQITMAIAGAGPDAVFICESRNNYRNILEALEIAVDHLEEQHELSILDTIKDKLGG